MKPWPRTYINFERGVLFLGWCFVCWLVVRNETADLKVFGSFGSSEKSWLLDSSDKNYTKYDLGNQIILSCHGTAPASEL